MQEKASSDLEKGSPVSLSSLLKSMKEKQTSSSSSPVPPAAANRIHEERSFPIPSKKVSFPQENLFRDIPKLHQPREKLRHERFQPNADDDHDDTEKKPKRIRAKKFNPDRNNVNELLKVQLLARGEPFPILMKPIFHIANFTKDSKPQLLIGDLTVGNGGHLKYLTHYLEALHKPYRVIGLDCDAPQLQRTQKDFFNFYNQSMKAINSTNLRYYYQSKFHFLPGNFENIHEILSEKFPQTVDTESRFDFLLVDLGPSFLQFSNISRGFHCLHKNGSLDMRYNTAINHNYTATDFLFTTSQQKLIQIFKENSHEQMNGLMKEFAKGIKNNLFRLSRRNTTTTQFNKLLADILHQSCTPKYTLKSKLLQKNYLNALMQNVYDMIRMEVNSEVKNLKRFLFHLPSVLAPGGRCVILTYNDYQDELVKKQLRKDCSDEKNKNGYYSVYSKAPIEASETEIRSNRRAKPCKLRYCIRSDEPWRENVTNPWEERSRRKKEMRLKGKKIAE
jgi:16S rRNA (cytosine1402-N4)-methyltransferase